MRPSVCVMFIFIFGILKNPAVSSLRLAGSMRTIAARVRLLGHR